MSETHLNNDDIVKCSCCHKIFNFQDFEKHNCKAPWIATKEILILDDYLELDVSSGKKILATGHDGTRYILKIQKPKAIPFIRRIFTTPKSDEDFTEPFFMLGAKTTDSS